MPAMSQPLCDCCRRVIEPGSGYCVKMEVFADSEMPPINAGSPGDDGEVDIAGLLKQMQDMSIDELQDGVHRTFTFGLCPACHRDFLANPLGRPRRVPVGGVAGQN
jgi:hypothetical protein